MDTEKKELAIPQDREAQRPQVFIIHGRNEAKRRELKELLEDRFGLDVVIMQEKPGKSRTLIEKFEQEAGDCNAAIAVLTPDDIVNTVDESYSQPRPNVIYELGWFAGKCGRSRTLMLVQIGTKIPSDLDGIEQLRFSTDISERLMELEREIGIWRQGEGFAGSPKKKESPKQHTA